MAGLGKTFVAGLITAAVVAPLIVVGLKPSPVRSSVPPAAEVVPPKVLDGPVATALPTPDIRAPDLPVPAIPAPAIPAPTASSPAVDDDRRPSRPASTFAPGRVEPATGEHVIGAVAAGRVVDVIVRPGDKVMPGDLLARLDESEAQARLTVAMLEVHARRDAREREGDERSTRRRRAEDAIWEAEQRLALARDRLDRSLAARLVANVPDEEIASARQGIAEAGDVLLAARDTLAGIRREPEAVAPRAADDALAIARAAALAARAALEATRIRSPIAATVLAVRVKPGEAVTPDGGPLLTLGNLDTLRVRAEFEAREFPRLRRGRRAAIHGDEASPALAEARITAIAPTVARSRLRGEDIDVIDVILDGDFVGKLAVGTRVRVRLVPDPSADAKAGAR